MKKRPRKIKQDGIEVTTSLAVRKAYHEAAHAIFADEYGILEEEGLMLRPPPGMPSGAGGGVKVTWNKSSTQHLSDVDRADIHQDIEVLLAATIAEIILLEQSHRRPNATDMMNLHVQAAHDLHAAIGKLRTVVEEEKTFEALRDAFMRTSGKVLKRWRDIEAVALACQERGALSRSEIRAIVAENRR